MIMSTTPLKPCNPSAWRPSKRHGCTGSGHGWAHLCKHGAVVRLRPADKHAHDEEHRGVRRRIAVDRAHGAVSLGQAAQQHQRQRDARRYAQLARQWPPCGRWHSQSLLPSPQREATIVHGLRTSLPGVLAQIKVLFATYLLASQTCAPAMGRQSMFNCMRHDSWAKTTRV